MPNTVCVIIDGEERPDIANRLAQLLELYQRNKKERGRISWNESWEVKNGEDTLLRELEKLA